MQTRLHAAQNKMRPPLNDEARLTLSVFAALVLLFTCMRLLNQSIFPYAAVIFAPCREISTYCGALFSVAVAFLAYRHPRLLHETAWSAGCFSLLAICLALMMAGIHGENRLLIALGSPFGGLGTIWLTVLVGVSLTKIDQRAHPFVIPGAYFVSFLGGFFAFGADGESASVMIALFFAGIVVAYALIRRCVHEFLETIRLGEPAYSIDAVNPFSFLRASSKLILVIFFFNMACGYFVEGRIVATPPSVVSAATIAPLLVIFLCAWVKRSPLSADALYRVSAMLILAAFLLAPLSSLGAGAPYLMLDNLFFDAGWCCFSLLPFLLIASIGAKNPLGSLTVSTFITAAQWLGIGCGAFLHRELATFFVDSLERTLLSYALLTFLFVVFIYAVLHAFDFKTAVQGVVPLTRAAREVQTSDVRGKKEVANSVNPESEFDRACELISAKYKLTPREHEVLLLLARGRTGIVIKEKLMISANTVKSHVCHIYAKLEVHSQQDLIDLVESRKDRL